MSLKWEIYCMDNEDEGWQPVWSDTEPTNCPNNAGHPVNGNSVRKIGNEIESLRISNINATINSSTLKKVLSFQYRPSILGTMRRICVLATTTGGGTTSYTMELLNLTNFSTIASKTVSSITENAIIDVGIIDTPPSTECVIDLNVKRDNGNGKITIQEIVIYVDCDL